MKISTFAVAVSIASVPALAGAVTAPVLDNITDLGATSIGAGTFHSFEYVEGDATGGAREFTYEFTAAQSTGSYTGVSLNPLPMNGITGLFVQWLSDAGDPSSVIAAWDGSATPFVVGFAAGETKYLNIGWDSSKLGGDVDVNIQAVPLPAGMLLLGTALAGLGVMRRKA